MILFMPRHLIPRLVLPLIGYLLFFLQLFYHVLFVTEKNQKVPAQDKISRNVLLLASRKRHSSVTQNFSQTTYRPNIGGKRTRFSRSNSNRICIAQTTFALSPLFGRLFAVFLIMPVFLLELPMLVKTRPTPH